MREYQKEYEEYMKSITDGFAKLCSFEGAESILAGEGNHVSVMIYQYQEFLLEYDKDLKYMYNRLESFDEREGDVIFIEYDMILTAKDIQVTIALMNT